MRIIKFMGREKQLDFFEERFRTRHPIVCEKCSGTYAEGDWPFCSGKVADHSR